ncbi:MAG: GntR family transcriptional regulator [Pirellulaceae bacterium]
MELATIRDKPIARTSLAASVYETLLAAIISGQIKEGTILTTVELAQRLGVSRTPVQEALQRLTADGLVQSETGRRATVARFSREDIEEVYGLRELLEGEAAARAASRLDIDAISEMRQGFVELLNESDDDQDHNWCARALESDLSFHNQLAIGCGSSRLADDIRRYRLLVRSFCRLSGTKENLQQAILEHLEIIAAFESQDAAAARAAMTRHIRSRLAKVLEKLFPETSP